MLTHSLKWIIFFATGLVIMLVNLDMTIVNLALATISEDMNITINQAQWIITSYLMATVLFFTIFGRLADIFGRKRIFLLGILLFSLGSLIAGLSHSLYILFIGRFIQGLGFAATLGLSFVIVFANFPPEKRGLVAGLAVTISGVAQALGPTVGGLIVEYLSWQWVFLINVPIGMIAFLLTLWAAPESLGDNKSKSISLVGVVLFILGFGTLIYVANQFDFLSNMQRTIFFITSFISLLLFAYSSYKVKTPLIKISLLTHKEFRVLITLRCLFMIFFSAVLFIIPLYLQNILGLTAVNAGLLMLSMTGFVALVSPITGKITDKYGYVIPVMCSLVLAFCAAVIGMLFSTRTSLTPLLIELIVLGIAVGLHVPASIVGVNKTVSATDAGTAMGLFFTLAVLGSTLGVALAGNMISITSTHLLYLKLGGETVNATLLHAASGASSLSTVPVYLQTEIAEIFMRAYADFMWVISGLMLTAVGIAIYLIKCNKNNVRSSKINSFSYDDKQCLSEYNE